MPIKDTKKCQTLINKLAEVAQTQQAAAARLQQLKAAFVVQNVDPTGTALEGKISQVAAWIDDIETIANSGVTAGLIAAKRDHHRGKALEV